MWGVIAQREMLQSEWLTTTLPSPDPEDVPKLQEQHGRRGEEDQWPDIRGDARRAQDIPGGRAARLDYVQEQLKSLHVWQSCNLRGRNLFLKSFTNSQAHFLKSFTGNQI